MAAGEPVTRQRQKWLRRQQQIVDSAARVFYDRGYDGTTMDDVAEEVGLLKSSLYYYFKSKEELLYAICRWVHDGVSLTTDRHRESEGPVLDRLREHLTEHLVIGEEGLDEAAIIKIQVNYREFRWLSPEHQAEISRERHEYEQYTRSLLEEAQRTGVACPHRDLHVLSPAILSMLNSVLLAFRPGKRFDWPHIAEEYVDFVLQGLTCPPSHADRKVSAPAVNGRKASDKVVGARRPGRPASRQSVGDQGG